MYIAILFASLAFLSLASIIAMPSPPEPMKRLDRYFGKAEEEESFYNRVFKPAGNTLAKMASRFLPSEMIAAEDIRCLQAGRPIFAPKGEISLLIQFLLFIGGAASAVAIAFLDKKLLPVIPLVLVVPWYAYHGLILFAVKGRKRAVLGTLPDALDLMVVSVEAGLGLDAAMSRVASGMKGALSDEFSKSLTDIRTGKSRSQALRDMSRRVELEELGNFVSSIIQADQLGMSLGKVLRVQSDLMRNQRRQRAEAEAHKAPIKMLFPLIFFVFPSLFLVLLGPAAMRLSESLLKK